jgi:hypothetical protein
MSRAVGSAGIKLVSHGIPSLMVELVRNRKRFALSDDASCWSHLLTDSDCNLNVQFPLASAEGRKAGLALPLLHFL